MTPSESEVLAALARVPYPGFTRDIVALGVVVDLRVEAGTVQFADTTVPSLVGGAPLVLRGTLRLQ